MVNLRQPANFPPVNKAAMAKNPLTTQGIELGRVLFYDKRLSGDNSLSCASCHLQKDAFADAGHSFSLGANGLKTDRHSPALFNLAWYDAYFWDGGAKDLESQAVAPIQAHNEMNQNLAGLVQELRNDEKYPRLFKQAFGKDTITTQKILYALAQFQRTLISADSRYDKFARNEPGGELTVLELQGLTLVKEKCASCHSTDLFTDGSYHNNGLDQTFSDDKEALAWGRGRITLKEEDKGKYRTPSLRNVALTAPYMHDGRFATLDQVLDHYSSGVKVSATLDSLLLKETVPGISLTTAQKMAITAFLHTLTDSEFIQNKAFAAPAK